MKTRFALDLSRLPRWLPAVALALCLLPLVGNSRFNNDEFTLMAAALRIAQGDVPYRDFFEFVAPGSLLLLAGVYSLFGATLGVTHLLATTLAWVTSVQVAGVARQLGATRGAAWLAAFAWAFAAYLHWSVYSHHWVALLPALGAIACGLRALATGRLVFWGLAGALTGVAGLTVQTDGPALGLALAAALWADAGLRGVTLRGTLARSAALGVGAGLVLALAAAGLAACGAGAAAWHAMVVWPTTQYKAAGNVNDLALLADLPELLARNGSPAVAWYGRMVHILATYGAVLAPLALLAPWAYFKPRATWTARDTGLLLVGVWALLGLAAQLRGRCDFVHVSFAALPAFLLVAVGASRLMAGGPGWVRRLPMAGLVGLVVSGLLTFGNAIRKEPEIWNRPLNPDARLLAYPAIAWVRERARPGDTIAALPYGGCFYVYGPRPAVSHSLMFSPAFGYTTAAEFDAYWREVATHRPRFLVLSPTPFATDPVASYTARIPHGYVLQAKLASPQFGAAYPAWIYTWEGGR